MDEQITENKKATHHHTYIQPPTVWVMLYEIFIRTLIFLAATVLISIVYKFIVNTGVFGLIANERLCRVVFCLFELLLLGVYWHYVFIFSKICRHCSYSLKFYHIQALAVFLVFCVIYGLSYLLMSRDLFLWAFRVTVNLIGVRMLTYAPLSLKYYMAAFLGVTFLIMMTEPYIAKHRFEEWQEIMEEIEEDL